MELCTKAHIGNSRRTGGKFVFFVALRGDAMGSIREMTQTPRKALKTLAHIVVVIGLYLVLSISLWGIRPESCRN